MTVVFRTIQLQRIQYKHNNLFITENQLHVSVKCDRRQPDFKTGNEIFTVTVNTSFLSLYLA
jgi:hypothetical protein